MKKNLAFALCALAAPLLAGCDFVGGGSDGPSVAIESISLVSIPATALDGQTDIVVAIQDASGRSIYQSEARQDVTAATLIEPFMTTGLTLAGSGIDRYIVVMAQNPDRTYRFVSISEAFSVESLSGSPNTDVTLVGAGYGGPASMAATLHVGDVAE